MSDHGCQEPGGRLPAVADCPDSERTEHREFLLRHIRFLTDTLAAEQQQRQWSVPCACPDSTPVMLARSRSKDDGSYPCCYERIWTPSEDRDGAACACGDPLHGSDDPLDAVAAVVISNSDSVVEHYFARDERNLIGALRERVGSWSDIASAGRDRLQRAARESQGGRVLDDTAVSRLQEALAAIDEHRYTEGTTLTDLPSVSYEYLHEMLAGLPGVDDPEAWWLLLTAFDKPVWPAADGVDGLLAELGLLDPADVSGSGRHHELEEELTDRQIPPLHRALAAHAHYCSGDHSTADCELRQFTLSHRIHEQAASGNEETLTVVDLFCGAGGLSHGFTRGVGAPEFDVALAIDQEQDATDTYRLNHPEIPHRQIRCEDIGNIAEDPGQIEDLAPEVDVVVGGPPCQALSVAGYRSRLADDDSYSVLEDPRTRLYQHYVSLLETLEPRYIIMENVEGILSSLGDSERRVIDDVEAALSEMGYTTDHQLLDCSTFGIPQYRDRVVLFGTREDAVPDPEGHVEGFFDDMSPAETPETTIQQALSNLPRLRRGEGGGVVAGRAPGRASDYVRDNELAGGTRLTYNHRAREHPMEKDRKLFSEVMEPGDTGWDVKYRTDYGHLIEYNVGTEENPAFKDKYRMLHWDQPSPTIVAHLAKDGNSFILPDYYEYARPDESKQDSSRSRGITPREAARLQSFPDSYVFLGPFTSQFRQIGNAVPPLLGERIASILGEYLTDAPGLETEATEAAVASTDD
ncbi:DNA cytosine methyltransferase [Haloglomus salinum]|uniref:DNA cytosine methyltransferase n=1 Tax=Haloglomus salinum TaxID=2962673 RepID=UPI0020C98036|nr:DNA cytosine methyltransferase [Haloglomus salinum]